MSLPAPVIFGCIDTKLTDEEKTFFSLNRPLGLILFTHNCNNPSQVRALINEFREIVEIDKDMEQLEKNCCFLDESFDDIQWTNSKAEKSYFELGKSKTYLKKSLQTLNHKMAVFN